LLQLRLFSQNPHRVAEQAGGRLAAAPRRFWRMMTPSSSLNARPRFRSDCRECRRRTRHRRQPVAR
jgi:hypothetical protein